MDKLRALHYFIAAAEEGSFSGAARRLEVSVPAIAKLIGALESELGVRLLDRNTQGLKLTAKGVAYLELCAPLVEQLAGADRAVTAVAGDPARTLVVGAPTLLSRLLIVPELWRFRERNAPLQVEMRSVDPLTVTDAHATRLDVLVALGRPGSLGLVQRHLAQSRLIICASPAYWERHGIPSRPRDLAQHQCLLVRTPEGPVLNLWRHTCGDETEEVAVQGWLTSQNRDHILQAVLGGHGVGRFADISVWPHLKSGALQPVLLEWHSHDAPPFCVLYRPEARRDPLIQSFVAFMRELIGALDHECQVAYGARPAAAPPGWFAKRPGRASGTLPSTTLRSSPR